VRQGVHDVVDADANAERGILLSSFQVIRARTIGSLIGIAAILLVLAWKFLVH